MATVNVNERSIIGDFLPTVYIDRITLESNGGEPPMHKIDPHVAGTSEELQSFVKDNVEIIAGRPVSGESKQVPLKVNLDLVIKQKTINTTNLARDWLSRIDFQKYFRVMVLQSTNPLATAMLASQNSTLSLLASRNAAEFNSTWLEIRDNFPGFDRPKAERTLRNSIDSKGLDSRVIRNAQERRYGERVGESGLDPENVWQDASGNTYQDIPVSLSFTLDISAPDHLAYFVTSTLDTEKIIADFSLQPDDDGYLALDGKKSIDVVINGGRVVSEAYIFHDANGQVWAGPVHSSKDGAVYAGNAGESNNPEKLTRKSVPNTKVQDFRIYDELRRYNIDTSSVKNMLNSSLFTVEMGKFARDQNIIKEASHWSSLALSKDEEENINYFFSIDMGNLLKKHTKYGHLFPERELDQALSLVKIISMRVFRRRVKKIEVMNKLGTPVSAEYVFDPNEEPLLLGSYGEGANPESSGLREVAGLSPSIPGVLHFSGTDSSMKDVTYGHYRYEVELAIEDGTGKFFERTINSMERNVASFTEYKSEAMLPRNYEERTNRFKEHFREDSRWSDTIENVLGNFIAAFKVLKRTGAATNTITPRHVSQLVNMSHPRTATPHGIGIVLSLIENLLDSYCQLLGYDAGARAPGQDSSVFSLPAQRSQRGIKLSSINLHHHFREVWNSDIPKNYGYNYLNMEPTALPGINVMSGTSLEERADIEIAKYFENTGDIQISDNKYDLGVYDTDAAKYSVFSPAVVHLGTDVVTLGPDDSMDILRNDKVVTAIAGLNLGFGSPFGGLIPYQDGGISNPWSHAAEFSSDASLKNSLVKNTIDVEVLESLIAKREEFDGREMSADCPPDAQEDRDDFLAPNRGPANPDPTRALSERGADGLRKFLSRDCLENGTGMNSNFEVNGNFFRQPELEKSLKDLAGESGNSQALLEKVRSRLLDTASARTGLSQPRAFNFNRGSGRGISTGSNAIARGARANAKLASALTKTDTASKSKHNSVQELPPQHASLISGAASKITEETLTAGGNIDPNQSAETFATMILNYRMLGELQFFTGYERNSEGVFMGEPKFETLDRIRLIGQAGKRILCRIVRYEDRELGFTEPKGLVMPIYDRYFILDVIGDVANLTAQVAVTTVQDRQETIRDSGEFNFQGDEDGGLLAALTKGQNGLSSWATNSGDSTLVELLGAAAGLAEEEKSDFNGLAELARQERQKREEALAAEKQRQLRCWQQAHPGIRAPDPWEWHADSVDWCFAVDGAPGSSVNVLTPKEAEYCRLSAKCRVARMDDCKGFLQTRGVGYLDRMQKCADSVHCSNFRTFRHSNPNVSPGRKCGVPCPDSTYGVQCHPDVYRLNIWIRM